jgi:Ala-tRNA(Pro) deacylase
MNTFEKILSYLDQAGVEYQHFHHAPVYTSEEAAQMRGLDLRQGAKSIILKVGDKFINVVVPGDKQVNLRVFKRRFGVKNIVFATDEELKELTGCVKGAVPPFGFLFGLEQFVDQGVFENQEIAFNAGSNEESVIMESQTYRKIIQAEVGEFAK